MKLALLGIAALSLLLQSCLRAPAQTAAKPPAAVPAAIVEVSGGKQIAVIGTPLEQPIVVQVNDAKGAAVAGASVWFRGANGAVLQPAEGVTGADGQFTTALTIGTIAGRYQIVAAAKGVEIDRKRTRLNSSHLGISYAG